MSAHRDPQMLEQLLGPSQPELSCDECFEQLDRYVELELAGADADRTIPRLRPHLDGCPACREDHDSLRELLEADASVQGDGRARRRR